MNGVYSSLADRVASLLPKTTAGACVPHSSWVESRWHQVGPHAFCNSVRQCHYSCYGAGVCTPWVSGYCDGG